MFNGVKGIKQCPIFLRIELLQVSNHSIDFHRYSSGFCPYKRHAERRSALERLFDPRNRFEGAIVCAKQKLEVVIPRFKLDSKGFHIG